MRICDYGCGKEAKYKFKNGKWCCENNANRCPKKRENASIKSKNPSQETRKRMCQSHLGQKSTRKGKKYIEIYGEEKADEIIKRIKVVRRLQVPPMKDKHHTQKTKNTIVFKNRKRKKTLTFYKEKYLLLNKIENMKEDENKNILVHCKNHDCINSKEKGGWFIVSPTQLSHRIAAIYEPTGFGESNFYCSDACKTSCMIFNSRTDPFNNIEMPYTESERQIWRKAVLEQDDNKCQKCSSKENLHCHHIIPTKLQPMFTLDPDNGIVLCEKCHYKYGHKTSSECDLQELAKIVCDGGKLSWR